MAATATRRAILGGTAAGAMVLPAFATGARSEEALFLAWQREVAWWRGRGNRSGLSENEGELCLDRQLSFERLILETPSTGIIAASVKTELLHRQCRDFLDTQYVQPLASILATLRGHSSQAALNTDRIGN